jgi:hypothetical protein
MQNELMAQLAYTTAWFLTPASRFWLVGSPWLRQTPDWPVQESDLLVILGNTFAPEAQVRAMTMRSIRCNKVLVFGSEERTLERAAIAGLWGIGLESLWWRDAGLVAWSQGSIRITTESLDITMSHEPEAVPSGVNLYGMATEEYLAAGVHIGQTPVRLADILEKAANKTRSN